MTLATAVLNAGQQNAAQGFFEFLLDNKQSEMIISGPGGVGKTFLMGYLIDQIMPRYFEACKLIGLTPEYDQVVMTATTNKAAEVLGEATGRPSQTIHSFLALTIQDNFSTGVSTLKKTANWTVHERKIIFVDEASMIDSPLLRYLREGTHKCKIVFVCDHCQLAPVMEPISPIFRSNLQMMELTEPMRNNNQPALMNICAQLRNTVETGEFYPIKIVPGVIDWVDDHGMQFELNHAFIHQNTKARVLAYTNQRVIDFNNHIRELRQLSSNYAVGEILINNSAVKLGKSMLRVEEELEIIRLGQDVETIGIGDVEFDIRRCDLQSTVGNHIYTDVKIPEHREHFNSLLNYFKKMKMWKLFYDMKNYYPDLRPRDAATVHKAQGSTYDTTFIDVGNVSACRNPDVAARMLYVAFTRAKNRVVLYGDLADKFGGLTY